MDGLIAQLVNSVSIRKSRRKFLPEPIENEMQVGIQDFLKILNPPFEHSVEVSLHEIPQDIKIFNFKGQNNAPLFAALRAPDTLEDQAKLGFIGELFILYCVSLGLGTCWIGRYKTKSTYQVLYGIEEERGTKKLFCVIPLGYCSDKRGLMEKMSNKMYSSRRKTVDQKFHEDSLKVFPNFIREALELARWAPSAMNSQCWYFKVEETHENFLVEIGKPQGYKHWMWKYSDIDVGTAAAHFWLGIKNKTLNVTVSIETELERSFWKFLIAK